MANVVPIGVPIGPIGPAKPAPVEVTRFHVHFDQLTKTRYGDYTLKLGVAKEDKDEAWKLTDWDGVSLEVVITGIPRINPLPIAAIDDAAISDEWETS